MNKKRIGQIIVACFVLAMGISFIDFGKNLPDHGEVIGEFIADNLEEGTTYRPIVVKRIDESMLLSQPAVNEAYATIIDSIGNQLELLSGQYISLDFQNQLQAATDFSSQLNLQNLVDYMPLDAALKRVAKKPGHLDKKQMAALYQEETRMHTAINELNAALGQYNLSVFSLDLGEESNPIYWHRFELSNELGSSEHISVFELENESGEVLSFKEI